MYAVHIRVSPNLRDSVGIILPSFALSWRKSLRTDLVLALVCLGDQD